MVTYNFNGLYDLPLPHITKNVTPKWRFFIIKLSSYNLMDRHKLTSDRGDTMQTQTVKEKITEVVLSQPEDASYDEIMRELAFERMVDRGLQDVRDGRVISNDELSGRIRTWQK